MQIMVMEVILSVILLLVGVTVLVTIHLCIVERAFRGENDGGNQRQSGSKRVSCDELKKLPCFEYKLTGKGGGSVVDCAICLENFKVGDRCRLLPNCSHSFHVECIDSWILKTPICPICRNWVLSQESEFSENAVIEMV